MGGCQNYGPFLDTLNILGRIKVGIQKGTIILTTTQKGLYWGSVRVYIGSRVSQNQGYRVNGLCKKDYSILGLESIW